MAGLLGLPFPNGLIPQAPFHTESLCVTVAEADDDEAGDGNNKGHISYRPTRVVEQRVSNLAQGLLTLGTMSGPLLVVLHLIPQAVLAGLFFIMGYQALEGNGITAKILFLCRDKALTPASHPLRRVRRRAAVWWFVALELVGFGATFAITQTVAAIGFPVFILALIPVRALLLPRLFSPDELGLLDGPTASPFTLEGIGESYGHHEEQQDEGVTASSSPGAGGPMFAGNRKSAEDMAERGRAPVSSGRENSAAGGETGKDGDVARVATNASAVSRRSQPGRSEREE